MRNIFTYFTISSPFRDVSTAISNLIQTEISKNITHQFTRLVFTHKRLIQANTGSISADQESTKMPRHWYVGQFLFVSPSINDCRHGIRKDVVTDFHYTYIYACDTNCTRASRNFLYCCRHEIRRYVARMVYQRDERFSPNCELRAADKDVFFYVRILYSNLFIHAYVQWADQRCICNANIRFTIFT